MKSTGVKKHIKLIKRDKYLLLMFLPFVVYFIIFNYIPMTGLIIAFKDFKPGFGIYHGDWVGFRWFIQFFESIFAYRIIRNTVLLNVYGLLLGFPAPILFALVIVEVKNMFFRRVVQTASYLPHFISTVVIVGLITNLFSVRNGTINNFIANMGGARIDFLHDPNYFRALFVGSGIWQGFGFGSILYISAITSINPELYEAAKMDGINKFREVIYITLPSISHTIIILFILSLGGIMSIGFEKAFLLGNAATWETADVISTYVYRAGISGGAYSFATAIGFFNSLINFTLVYTANRIIRKTTQTSLW